MRAAPVVRNNGHVFARPSRGRDLLTPPISRREDMTEVTKRKYLPSLCPSRVFMSFGSAAQHLSALVVYFLFCDSVPSLVAEGEDAFWLAR